MKTIPPSSGNQAYATRLLSSPDQESRQRTQPTIIVATPIRQAGVPPRKTIASTSDRKLPEIFADAVAAAVRSLATEKTSSEANRAMSQFASSEASTATTAAAASATHSSVMK